jgi:hypothetical protein
MPVDEYATRVRALRAEVWEAAHALSRLREALQTVEAAIPGEWSERAAYWKAAGGGTRHTVEAIGNALWHFPPIAAPAHPVPTGDIP